MYMPGRRRTGSRPSRTVMSFAEYDAFAGDFAIKGNACKTTVLPAAKSVSDRAVRGAPGEPQTDRFLHTFAQLLVLDGRGDLGRSLKLFGARRRRRVHRRRGLARRERARCEAHLRNPEPRGDLRCTMPELERPDRVGGRDVQGAVARDP